MRIIVYKPTPPRNYKWGKGREGRDLNLSLIHMCVCAVGWLQWLAYASVKVQYRKYGTFKVCICNAYVIIGQLLANVPFACHTYTLSHLNLVCMSSLQNSWKNCTMLPQLRWVLISSISLVPKAEAYSKSLVI